MATYETDKSNSLRHRTLVGSGWGREIVSDSVAVTMTTAMIDNANDDVGLLWVPKGAVIVGALLSATDMDTATTPALLIDVGDADDENRIFAASAVGGTGTSSTAIATAGHLYKYTANTQLRAYINAAATTGAEGTLKFTVFYFIDPENIDATPLVAA
jgi:hypothetical protein